jgi:Leucine carboxyl methyltransferase
MAAAMRASHLLVDDPPPIFRDDYALALSEIAADDAIALARGFDPPVGAVFRAAALVRARFTDEQVEEATDRGVGQYVILGAGLDSFPWRRPELVARLQVFEVDHPGTQEYKRVRLAAVGLSDPPSLHFVPVDFTSGIDLGAALSEAGLVDAVAASTANGFGVPPYGIGDNRYIDGGYRRNENADLAAGYGRVLVLSPFGGRSRHPLEWGMHLAAQVDELRASGGNVETIFPDGNSLKAFGVNMMDLSTRPPAARAGYDQGSALAEQLTDFWH